MPFALPTVDQMIYRVMRLRRLIAVSAAIPMLFLLAVFFAAPDFLSPAQTSLAILGVAAAVLLHAVLFPNVTLETVAVAIAGTALSLMLPVLEVISRWAPVDQQSGAFLLLVMFGIGLAGLLVVVAQIGLGAFFYGGPVVRRVMHHREALPCSAKVAYQQLALRPETRRGRVLTGACDENGFFDVAVAVGGTDHAPECVKVDAKVLGSDPARHDVMLLTRAGAVTVTSIGFTQTETGCIVDVRDMPGDFTLGMYLLFWLTDQQADNLTEMTDALFGHEARANGLAHTGSLVAAAGMILSPRAPMID
jgi:hypothetical protein